MIALLPQPLLLFFLLFLLAHFLLLQNPQPIIGATRFHCDCSFWFICFMQISLELCKTLFKFSCFQFLKETGSKLRGHSQINWIALIHFLPVINKAITQTHTVLIFLLRLSHGKLALANFYWISGSLEQKINGQKSGGGLHWVTSSHLLVYLLALARYIMQTLFDFLCTSCWQLLWCQSQALEVTLTFCSFCCQQIYFVCWAFDLTESNEFGSISRED